MRADAAANQDRLLAAARALLLERGPAVSLDQVARRAGVGSATLYRRFPDRRALLLAVVVQAMRASAEAARTALTMDARHGLDHYLHAVLDLQVAAVIPVVLDELGYDDPDIGPDRQQAADAFDDLVDAAHARGALAPEVSAGDLGSMLVRLARPLPGIGDEAKDQEMAHRHLELFLRGVRPLEDAEGAGLGPGPGTEDLRPAGRRGRAG